MKVCIMIVRPGRIGPDCLLWDRVLVSPDWIKREQVRASVFGDRMAPPSMTLEEFGDKQMQEAMARETAEKDSEQNVVKKYKDLVASGEEDETVLVDQATIKDREWDEFKEDNPRGWGNKMGKRF
eukprot:gene11663-24429_t